VDSTPPGCLARDRTTCCRSTHTRARIIPIGRSARKDKKQFGDRQDPRRRRVQTCPAYEAG